MFKLIYTFCAIILCASLYGQENWQSKVSPALFAKLDKGHPEEFLIVLRQQADVSSAIHMSSKEEKAHYVFNTLRDYAEKKQRSLSLFLDSRNIPFQPLFVANVIKAFGTIQDVQLIAHRDDVYRIISEEPINYAEPIEMDADYSYREVVEWGIERINADDVWALGYKGQGVVVGGEDTGYQWTHPSIKNQYRGYHAPSDTVDHNYNWHDAIHRIDTHNVDSINPCGLDVLQPCDDRGHGTHTMGTMVGLDGENQIGVAPEAKWCGCRNMERGWGTPFTYIECFQWFLGPTDLNNENPDPSKAPHVINNSWSCPVAEGCDSSNWEVMNLVINNLKAAGIVVVVSAGNSGSSCGSVSTPAAMFEGSFSVGATAFNDTIAGFSSRGPVVVDSSFRLKPNVAAPGVGIRSATLDGGYGFSSGTSMAGPHVAGLVALMISANPDLAGKVDVIENIIEQTAVPKTTNQNCGAIPGSSVPNHTYGFGRVDALAAVEAALTLITNTHDQSSDKRIIVFPNPVHDKLYVELMETMDDVTFQLFDGNGRLILNNYFSNTQRRFSVNLDENLPGLYFYKLIVDRAIYTGRIIKQ